MPTSPRDVSQSVASASSALAGTLPFDDQADLEAVERGFIGARSPGAITDAGGVVVWDSDSYGFLDGDCPPTANPSLWRQSRLVAKQGLFEVTPGLYQLRGFDLSNMSIIEGDTGIIVVDPLIAQETAAAALALYREHRGDRPVIGVLYTHSHIDHFGGVKGVTTQADVDSGRCVVIAPAGFVGHAIEENVYAGTAMGRRAAYMYGAALPRGPRGSIGAGLGQTNSTGTPTLILPTVHITHTGQTEKVDGVTFEFQLTPGTEAPAELNFFLPAMAALCMAENATHTLHNLLTLRGALVRDPHVWAHYLNEAITLYASRAEVVFASHHWPTWGREQLTTFLSQQRDLYGYLHDQTLRMVNQGYTGMEIAERIELPPALRDAWSTHGYYGSVSHNVKAIYQRYMGWFDGNPAHLWEHPPVESAKRHVEFMGGADEVLRKARATFDAGDFRWTATVLNYVIFADPENTEARSLQADTLEQLGYGAENGTWRNFFLTGALELRDGSVGTPVSASAPDILTALTVGQLFDSVALRVDGPNAWDTNLTIDWNITGHGVHRSTLSNGVLIHHDVPAGTAGADTTFSLSKTHLLQLFGGAIDLGEQLASGAITVEGDPALLGTLVGHLDQPDPDFAIVTP
jgi:alkyl sulfatase BDS1-like metallo-beta-lactamase superfamily hydrolase